MVMIMWKKVSVVL